MHRLGEIRDRTYENQQHRASGLNLLVSAITLWNTRYLNRAAAALREVEDVPDHLLSHLSPLGWEHINLTGDYVWSPADAATENHAGSEPCGRSPTQRSSRPEFPICPLMRIREAFRYFRPMRKLAPLQRS